MPTAQHRKFDLGMVRDAASFTLPEGACYDANNMLFDKLGIARKRGGIQGLGSTTTYRGDHLGALLKDDGAVQLYSMSYNGALPIIDSINSTTGAFTQVGASAPGLPIVDGGRPFQHYGFLVFPTFTNDPATFSVGFLSVGGATGSLPNYTFTLGGSVVLTAGSKRVTCAAGDSPLAHMQVGMIFVSLNAAATQAYIGRVTRVVSTTAFDVYPTPSVGFTAGAGAGTFLNNYSWTGTPELLLANPAMYKSGKVGMSFQGRILLGACNLFNPVPVTQTVEYYPRRVYFSATLLEGTSAFSANKITGAAFLQNSGWPELNYFDIPAQEEITAMSPTGFGDALIFSAQRTFRLTGNLSTQFGTEQSITWSPREIPNSVGCMSERSLQRTPRGVIFAHSSGIYTTDGNNMQPLMYGKIQDLWKSYVAGSDFKIFGSALIRGNHYYICGQQTTAGNFWALQLNLDTLAWSRVTGKVTLPASFLINGSVADSSIPSRTWGLKYWNQSIAAPSMTGGQLLQLESMFSPSASNRSDSDGTLVQFNYQSRSYTEESPTIQKIWRQATVEYKNIGGASCIVKPNAGLDTADGFGNSSYSPIMGKQDPQTITGATNAAPIVLTVPAGHDISADMFVRVRGVLGNTNANGVHRVQVAGATTITLMGSYGNAAYTSGGTVQVVDQRDFSLNTSITNAEGAGMMYEITDGTLGADEFELYGITHTWEDRDPHAE